MPCCASVAFRTRVDMSAGCWPPFFCSAGALLFRLYAHRRFVTPCAASRERVLFVLAKRGVMKEG